MRILLSIHVDLNADTGAGGAVIALAKEYRKQGHDVTILSFDDLSSKLSILQKSLVFPWFIAKRIWQAPPSNRWDVVDASTGDLWIYGSFRKSQRPCLVTHSHGLEHVAHEVLLKAADEGEVVLSRKYPLYHGGWRLREVNISLRKSDYCFMLNNGDREFARDRIGIPSNKLFVVPNGIPDEFLNLPLLLNDRVSLSAPVKIAQIGRYVEGKGIRYTAAIMNRLMLKYAHVTLTFLGAAIARDRVLADYAPELHSRITVTPFFHRRDLPSLLRGHQIKLFPSKSEGFSLALIEAMSCGLAPVGFRIPAFEEVISHWEDGVLVERGDVIDLEQSVERLIIDPRLLQRLQSNAYKRAQFFSWESAAKLRLRHYADLSQSLD